MNDSSSEDRVVETVHNPDGSVTEKFESGDERTRDKDGKNEHGILHFWTTGKDMTDMAREIWVGGDSHRAIRFCIEGFDMTETQAVQLITGEMKLVGNTRKGNHTLAFVKDGATMHLGIPLSLTYHLLQAEKRFHMNTTAMHMVMYPWFYIDYNSPKKIDPAKNMRGAMQYGDPYQWMSTNALTGYKDFERWIRYTTMNGKLETKWFTTPIMPGNAHEKIQALGSSISTEQFIAYIQQALGNCIQQEKTWKEFFGIQSEEDFDKFLGIDDDLEETEEEYEARAKRCKKSAQEHAKSKKALEEVENLVKPYKDWDIERIKTAMEHLDEATENLVMTSMTNTHAMASITGDFIDNGRMLESVLNRLGLLHREPDPEPDPKFSEPSGWIDRNGDYYHCWYMGHIELAQAIVDNMCGPGKNGEGVLETEGWLKISEMRLLMGSDRPITTEQKRTLKALIKKYGAIKYTGEPSDDIDALCDRIGYLHEP